ncbi:sensor histidine kinase [Coriobacterium glomerans]|uniref:sensor histidine kinase n=1 Tax=Coriobacterium glomerans TaxID=33871 RepID=UPI001FE020AB|nr:HAMP domain-containing sensor histidine kinase [Coriobacterium glomerans]
MRRLIWFCVLDLLLLSALVCAFVFQSIQQLPASARAGQLLAPGSSWVLASPRMNLAALTLSVTEAGGTVHEFHFSDHAAFTVSVVSVVVAAEVIALLSGFSEARRIRRKLRPLNELALTAEAIGTRADEPGAGDRLLQGAKITSKQKFESLKHAISEATVEAPRISTGDKDLRSIEVALNGLLHRMQEAKAQQARFVSDASHELRTPLAVIKGYVGMLDRWGKDDPEVLEESISALKAESEHMGELVEQLLFLARGDSGRNTLERTVFDLGDLVADVAEESHMIDENHRYEMRADRSECGREDHAEGTGHPQKKGWAARTGGATQHMRAAAAPLMVYADRALIKQSLRIMVQNAARYSPSGSSITLSVQVDSASGRIGYAVTDEGQGMTPSDARHIFERFYRADDARATHRGGTGLGLSIAKWIVDAHGGEIEVASREGLGTRFTVWLSKSNPSA